MDEHYYRFLNEAVLVHLFWLLPLLLVIFAYAGIRRKVLLKRIAGSRMLESLQCELSRRKRWIKALLLIVAAALIVGALARPAWNPQTIEAKQKGRDVVFLLDVSKSMLAEDVSPSRLNAAKFAIDDTISSVNGDKVGLVAFSGNASILCPLTLDYSFFRNALDGAGVSSVDVGGTMLADAVRKCLHDMLAGSDVAKKDIVIITDGGDEDKADDKFAIEAAREAAEQGVRIITIGIGSEKNGRKIPYTTEDGRKEFLQYNGKDVVTRLNADVLRKMAKATPGGVYINVGTNAFDFPSIYQKLIGSAEKVDLGDSKVTTYTEGFPYLLAVALILLLAEYILNDKRANGSREVEQGE